MKLWNQLYFIKVFAFLLLSCFILVSCNNLGEEVKGDYDIRGNIVGINSSDNRILIKNKQDGLTWVVLHENLDMESYAEGQEVVVWGEGNLDASPSDLIKAVNIEIIQPEP